MGKEIERKFLVKNQGYQTTGHILIKQGYILSDIEKVVRVRIEGDAGYLTIKGKTVGASRNEFEYPIPLSDAEEMLSTLCNIAKIEKSVTGQNILVLPGKLTNLWETIRG